MLIDIGANLTHESFAHDLPEILADARAAGIEKLIVTGATPKGSCDALALASDHPDTLYATAGIHPHHAEAASNAALAEIARLLQHDAVRAVGETGLDFFRDFSPRSSQISAFERHIELAIETGLPMFLHERDAYPTFFEVLAPHRDALSDVVVHCFTGERDALHAYLDLDCHIGITGWICDERRGQHLVPLVRDIPMNRLMLETDAPYLIPRNIRPKPKTRRNEPRFLTYILDFVAASLDLDREILAHHSSSNARRFFRL